MLSKSSINLRKRINERFGLQIHYNRSMAREIPTHRTKDKEMISNLGMNLPRHREIRVMGKHIRTHGRGEGSRKSLGITPMNVDQSSHWWLR